MKLVLAGPLDVHGENLRRQVRELGLDDDVVFTGTIREDDLPEVILTLADIFVFPSLYEGFGIPPLEAMACGTPVVASNLTAIPEVVGEAGLLVNPLNIEELARAISSLLNNRDLHGRYSALGLTRAEQFRSEQTAGQLYRHIIHLLEAHS